MLHIERFDIDKPHGISSEFCMWPNEIKQNVHNTSSHSVAYHEEVDVNRNVEYTASISYNIFDKPFH